MNQNQEIDMAGGKVSSTKGPALHLIPTEALERLAARFEKGIQQYKDKAWNALSQNQECLMDKELILERIAHVIHHCYKLRDKIQNDQDLFQDDDAGAILWGGAFLVCATAKSHQKPKIWDLRPDDPEIVSTMTKDFEKICDNFLERYKNCKEEVSMESGYFLFNTMTHKIFGTTSYATPEEAQKAIEAFELKWRDNPKDRRDLAIVSVRYDEVVGVPKEEEPKGVLSMVTGMEMGAKMGFGNWYIIDRKTNEKIRGPFVFERVARAEANLLIESSDYKTAYPDGLKVEGR